MSVDRRHDVIFFHCTISHVLGRFYPSLTLLTSYVHVRTCIGDSSRIQHARFRLTGWDNGSGMPGPRKGGQTTAEMTVQNTGIGRPRPTAQRGTTKKISSCSLRSKSTFGVAIQRQKNVFRDADSILGLTIAAIAYETKLDMTIITFRGGTPDLITQTGSTPIRIMI